MAGTCVPCAKSSRAKAFVVTDASGNCLDVDDQGRCVEHRTANSAHGAARTAGLTGFQVRPRG
jgi:hypothetical protein